MDRAPDKLPRWPAWTIPALALLYGAAHLAWYAGTPLGRVAVLDERENLQLAHALVAGTLPPEPFYRAMGYPLFLSGLDAAGLLPGGRPLAATAAGLLLHVLNTALALVLARRWFRSAWAGRAAGLLFGLNPVFLHYATQVLDSTLAGSLLLAGLLALPVRREAPAGAGRAAGLAAAWAAAALVRPQLLPLALGAPLLWWLLTRDRPGFARAAFAAVAAGGALGLAHAAWGWHVGGEFRLLPWQGPYNLWAANHPGAHGRYYVQTRPFAPADPARHENPARLESIALWREATGAAGPVDPAALNAYWSARLRREIAAQPAAWLALEARKLAWLLADAEQYNNKTYAFHRARSPWLRPNPLGWAVALGLGATGLAVLAAQRPAAALALGLALGLLAAGVLASYVSARFRLPLAMVLTVLAGGIVPALQAWPAAGARRRAALVAPAGLLAAVALANPLGAADRSTFVQDHLLLAAAAERTGDDRVAWDEARAALRLRPDLTDARRLAVSAGFNLLLAGAAPAPAAAAWAGLARPLAGDAAHPQANLVALALWRNGEPAGAALWRRRAEGGDVEARLALGLAGEAPAEAPAGDGPFARLARAAEPELGAARARLFTRP